MKHAWPIEKNITPFSTNYNRWHQHPGSFLDNVTAADTFWPSLQLDQSELPPEWLSSRVAAWKWRRKVKELLSAAAQEPWGPWHWIGAGAAGEDLMSGKQSLDAWGLLHCLALHHRCQSKTRQTEFCLIRAPPPTCTPPACNISTNLNPAGLLLRQEESNATGTATQL